MNVLKRIKRIGYDIRTRQNIDVYISIVISIIIALLGILGIVNQTVIFSALLAVTAIITYGMLVNRQQNEEVMDVLSNLKLRVIDYFAPYTMYLYDPELPSGKIMVRLSTLEVLNTERPTYYLTNKYDKDWFGFHFKQFEIAWEKAEEWCIGDPSH